VKKKLVLAVYFAREFDWQVIESFLFASFYSLFPNSILAIRNLVPQKAEGAER